MFEDAGGGFFSTLQRERVRELLKLVAALALVGAAGVAFVSLQRSKGYGLREGSPAPPLALPALSGGTVDLASFRSRVVVINFWATWCPPCVEEMPSLERLHRALGGEGLVVLGVSVDEDETPLRTFVAERGVTFPILRDPGGRVAAGAYRTTGYPETFIVDAEGRVRSKIVGPAEWDTPEALDHFRGLLRSLKTSPTK